MKILFVAPRFHTNQYQLVKTLQENKHEVYFHVNYLGPTEDHSLLTPKTYKRCKFSQKLEHILNNRGHRWRYYFPNMKEYWREFSALKPDLVIIRDPTKYFSFMVAICALLTRAKIVFYTQEEIHRFRKMRTWLKQTLLLRIFKAAWISPMNGSPGSGIRELRHMYYVPLPIPLPSPLCGLGKNGTGIPKLLMVGKYHQERKKHNLFIDTVYELSKKHRLMATIVGECVTEGQKVRYAALEDKIDRLGLRGVIELKKNIPFKQMENLYASHDIYVLPSVNEPYSISVLEALSYGLPVICTDTCGSALHILNGENGYVVVSNSLQSLTAALESMIIDKNKLLQMSAKSRNYVEQHLTGKAFYNKFTHLLASRFQINA